MRQDVISTGESDQGHFGGLSLDDANSGPVTEDGHLSRRDLANASHTQIIAPSTDALIATPDAFLVEQNVRVDNGAKPPAITSEDNGWCIPNAVAYEL
jgi:hypothetical protein